MRVLLPLLLLLPGVLRGQAPPALKAERADFERWLESSSVSPYAAIYHQPFFGELVIGPGGDPALRELPPGKLDQGLFRLTLETPAGDRTVPRNRAVPFHDDWHVRVSGTGGRTVVTIFGPLGEVDPPGWYPHDPELVVIGVIESPERPETRRMLGLDGIEVEATRAGMFVGDLSGEPVRLLVYRMPVPGTEESELNIFFRDETNDNGTYPAGRFLTLTPLGGSRYRADFNRTRNPFCAYNTVFPCPLPWRGNLIDRPIEAGERYRSQQKDAMP